jgi:hypothetical protein
VDRVLPPSKLINFRAGTVRVQGPMTVLAHFKRDDAERETSFIVNL